VLPGKKFVDDWEHNMDDESCNVASAILGRSRSTVCWSQFQLALDSLFHMYIVGTPRGLRVPFIARRRLLFASKRQKLAAATQLLSMFLPITMPSDQ